MSSQLFSPIKLRELELANRVVISPMCQFAAIDGTATDWHLMHLGQFAMGAAGLVMTEATAVSRQGRIAARCLGLYSDENEAGLKRVVDFCKKYGVAAIGVQLAHSGRKGARVIPSQDPLPEGDSPTWPLVGASPLPYDADWPVPEALDQAGLNQITRDFAESAVRADRIGVDLIELHMAHGYLAHGFLSPIANQRTDDYGGTLANRMRFPLETFDAVRAVWPDSKPLGVRISATDHIAGGWDLDQSVAFAKVLAEHGCDFIDVSSGGLDPRQQIKLGPGYQVPYAERIRKETELAVWSVGMIRDPHLAEEIIASGAADMIALARGVMYDPRWAWHAAEELGAETAYAAKYARCHPEYWPEAFPEREPAA